MWIRRAETEKHLESKGARRSEQQEQCRWYNNSRYPTGFVFFSDCTLFFACLLLRVSEREENQKEKTIEKKSIKFLYACYFPRKPICNRCSNYKIKSCEVERNQRDKKRMAVGDNGKCAIAQKYQKKHHVLILSVRSLKIGTCPCALENRVK